MVVRCSAPRIRSSQNDQMCVRILMLPSIIVSWSPLRTANKPPKLRLSLGRRLCVRLWRLAYPIKLHVAVVAGSGWAIIWSYLMSAKNCFVWVSSWWLLCWESATYDHHQTVVCNNRALTTRRRRKNELNMVSGGAEYALGFGLDAADSKQYCIHLPRWVCESVELTRCRDLR